MKPSGIGCSHSDRCSPPVTAPQFRTATSAVSRDLLGLRSFAVRSCPVAPLCISGGARLGFRLSTSGNRQEQCPLAPVRWGLGGLFPTRDGALRSGRLLDEATFQSGHQIDYRFAPRGGRNSLFGPHLTFPYLRYPHIGGCSARLRRSSRRQLPMAYDPDDERWANPDKEQRLRQFCR
jgi:hypothetical protein